MPWRDNSGKDSNVKEQELNKQSDTVKKAYDDVQQLKEKIKQIKEQTSAYNETSGEGKPQEVSFGVKSSEPIVPRGMSREEIEAAERAVREQAIRDSEKARIQQERRGKEEELRIKVAKLREKESRERSERMQREAAAKRQKAKEAREKIKLLNKQRYENEIKAEISKRRKEQSERQEQELRVLEEIERQHLKEVEETAQANFEKKREDLETQRRLVVKEKILQEKKAKQEAKRKAEEEARRQRELRKQAEIKARQEEKQAQRAEKLEAQKRKEERDLFIARQRAIQKEKRRRLKQEEKEREAAKRKARKASIKKERAEKNAKRRERRLAKKSAEMGGGIVHIHGTTVHTEIQPVPAYSLRELLGIEKRREIKKAATKAKKKELIAENERIKQEARATAAQLAEVNRIRRKNSNFYKKLKDFGEFCEAKKTVLLVSFSIVLTVAVGTAGVLNYCTAYEYSYNGAKLGYIKNKDDVLQVTEMVQNALSEERNATVVIDGKKDIKFERVYTLNKDIVLDTTEEVLKRMTYMGDLNIKAYGIYIDGKKVGAVESKEVAADVLQTIEDKYASNRDGAVIEEAVILEDIKIKKSNTDFKDVYSKEQMVEKLCTSGVKESVHTVVKGETLAGIARDHGLTEEDILKYNKNVKPEKLEVGSALVIKETAPIMTVKITEVRTYDKKTDYETVKKKDKDLYEGYTEIDKEGKKGLSELTDRTVSVNGEVVETVNLKNDIKKKPVTKVVRVGTKERPPTVGSGTYIWPAHAGTYTVTSEFKWRWGRQHEGIDMGCPVGTDVLASDGGTVTYAGYMGGYGLLVIIDHQNGVETYYGHNSGLVVSVGDKVFQGQHIAEAGNTGRSTGPHIHFGVKDHGTFCNPRNYLP